jgi:hypothetical protein
MTLGMLKNRTARQRQALIPRFRKRWRLRRMGVKLGMSRENGVAQNGAPCCAGWRWHRLVAGRTTLGAGNWPLKWPVRRGSSERGKQPGSLKASAGAVAQMTFCRFLRKLTWKKGLHIYCSPYCATQRDNFRGLGDCRGKGAGRGVIVQRRDIWDVRTADSEHQSRQSADAIGFRFVGPGDGPPISPSRRSRAGRPGRGGRVCRWR